MGFQQTIKKVWFVLAANSIYMGGGMKFSPSSVRDDDLLELLVIHRIPKDPTICDISDHLFW